MPPIAALDVRETAPPAPKPLVDGHRGTAEQVLVIAFVVLPLAAFVTAIPFAWGWGLNWVDAGVALGMYAIT